jgi:hypothetical protein
MVDTNESPLIHICEVCDRTETMTPSEAFDEGWDYPPRMGVFGTVSPRTCGDCPITGTVWAAPMLVGKEQGDLTDKQKTVLSRILGETETILPCV